MTHPAPSPPYAPHDPYRARARAPLSKAGIPRSARSLAILFTALATLGFFVGVGFWGAAFASATHGTARPEEGLLTIGGALLCVSVLLCYGQVFAGLYWVYKAWDWLPPEQRYTRHWRSWIPPAQAALFLLIPYFQYYWMFLISCGLCDALDRMRVMYPTGETSSKGLAIAAGVCQLVVPFPIGAILWTIFMSKCERMMQEMSDASARMPYAA